VCIELIFVFFSAAAAAEREVLEACICCLDKLRVKPAFADACSSVLLLLLQSVRCLRRAFAASTGPA
jgi:hypothetical protein